MPPDATSILETTECRFVTATIANDVDLSDVMIGFFAKEVLSLLDVRRRFCGCFSPFNRSFAASEVACTGLHEVTKGRIPIKASGGIRRLSQAIDLINAGASRLGTSQGVQILREQRQD